MKHFKPIAFVALILGSCNVAAQSLPITPGMWETTMNQTNPFTGSKTTVNSECVKETEFNPNTMMDGNEECTVTDSSVTGNKMNFAMNCNMDGASATMLGVFESNGDSGTGNMTMNVSLAGQKIEMKMDWTARRTGDC